MKTIWRFTPTVRRDESRPAGVKFLLFLSVISSSTIVKAFCGKVMALTRISNANWAVPLTP